MDKQQVLQPRKGAVAYCGIEFLGLITSDAPQEVTYSDGNKAMAWVGIQLRHDECVFPFGEDAGKLVKVKPGDPWSARHPRVVGYIDEFVE